MRYQGSKYKMRNVINEFVKKVAKPTDYYVEPFMGGCNSLAYIDHERKIGIDCNRYMVSLWNDIKNGTFNAPKSLTKDEYQAMKDSYLKDDGKYSDSMIGYVGTSCSYGSGWWNGYAAYNEKKKEDHILEAYNGINKQIKQFNGLNSCEFICASYDEVIVPEGSFIYCDPPYANTKKYENDFDSGAFWNWVRKQVERGCKVLVSEYVAPSDFKCVWHKDMQDGMALSNNRKTEKMFVHRSQYKRFTRK